MNYMGNIPQEFTRSNSIVIGGIVLGSVENNITAGAAQESTNLTAAFSVVTTVAAGHGVTLIAAAIKAIQVVFNNTVTPMKIWPATGDDLGAGVNNAITIGPGAIITFRAYDSTNWKSGS